MTPEACLNRLKQKFDDASFVKEVSDVVGEKNGLNMVIHNAGYMAPNRDLDKITPEDMMMSYEVNCVGSLFLTRYEIQFW